VVAAGAATAAAAAAAAAIFQIDRHLIVENHTCNSKNPKILPFR